MTIYILNRANLHEWGRLGRSGRMAGEFHWLHQLSVDSKGNVYTGEVDTGKRIQKFIRYGSESFSGARSSTVGGVATCPTRPDSIPQVHSATISPGCVRVEGSCRISPASGPQRGAC